MPLMYSRQPITCRTKAEGTVDIKKHDAVALVGDYTVGHAHVDLPVFGQALSPATENGVALPVRVKGICPFRVTSTTDESPIGAGVVCGFNGAVFITWSPTKCGTILRYRDGVADVLL